MLRQSQSGPTEPESLKISLLRAPDDSPPRSAAYQEGLREFERTLHAQGLDVSVTIELMEAAGGVAPAIYLGDFAIRLAATVGPFIGTAIGAWLHAKYGRKVRLKIGEVEVEGQSVEDVQQLLDHAEQFQQRTQNIIQEP